jgi:hypothetical protein
MINERHVSMQNPISKSLSESNHIRLAVSQLCPQNRHDKRQRSLFSVYTVYNMGPVVSPDAVVRLPRALRFLDR